jgi:hypothetical protein
MVGAGRHGYVCAGRNTRTCPDPQQLAEGAARTFLAGLLPDALERGRVAIERAVRLRDAARTPRAQALAKKRRELEAVQEQLVGVLRLAGAGTSPTVTAEAQRLMAAERALLAAVARLERGDEVAAAALTELTAAGEPVAWFGKLDAEQQGQVYRLLLADVRIAGAGRGAGRRYALVGAPRHLLEEQAAALTADTTISAPSSRSTTPYVPIPLPETLTHLTALLRRRAA